VRLIEVRKDGLWPVEANIQSYSEDDLFDIVEFLYEDTSKGIDGSYHNYNDPKMRYSKFDRELGRAEYRERVSRLLAAFAQGFELSDAGEVLTMPEPGFESTQKARCPGRDPESIDAKVQAATLKLQSRSRRQSTTRTFGTHGASTTICSQFTRR